MTQLLPTISIVLGLALFALIIYKIVYEIRDNYENKPEDLYLLSLVEEIRKIDPRIDNIVDELRFFEGRKSYTINKTFVHICKNDKYGNLYEKNQLVLVLLHEIAHAVCDEVGHTDKFMKILDEFLELAELHGIYNSNIPHVPDYCEY